MGYQLFLAESKQQNHLHVLIKLQNDSCLSSYSIVYLSEGVQSGQGESFISVSTPMCFSKYDYLTVL